MSEKRVFKLLMVVCFAFLFTSFVFSSLSLPVKAAANVTIVNHTHYMDYGNYYHVVGEVQNIGDVPVKNVHVSITFYDIHDVVVESTDQQVLLIVLLVGRKAPFMYPVSTTENSARVSYYILSVSSFETTSELPLGLEILSHNSVIAGYIVRVMTVTGQIKNVWTSTAHVVRTVATFYDGPSGTGNVIGASIIPPVPYDLNPKEVGTFTLVQDVTGREQLFVSGSYVLTAEAMECAIVPEFPTPIISMIFMIAMLVAAAMIRKRSV